MASGAAANPPGTSPGKLLLVDDESSLVDLLKRYLERMGFVVDACTDPVAALELVKQPGNAYALLVTDLTLPGITGEELILRAREWQPDLPALLTSGYPYQQHLPRTAFLQKPFLPKMLAETIESLMQGRPAPDAD
jgi:CheY-like chemotaxis protein